MLLPAGAEEEHVAVCPAVDGEGAAEEAEEEDGGAHHPPHPPLPEVMHTHRLADQQVAVNSYTHSRGAKIIVGKHHQDK